MTKIKRKKNKRFCWCSQDNGNQLEIAHRSLTKTGSMLRWKSADRGRGLAIRVRNLTAISNTAKEKLDFTLDRLDCNCYKEQIQRQITGQRKVFITPKLLSTELTPKQKKYNYDQVFVACTWS